MQIEVTSTVSDADRDAVRAGLNAYNRAYGVSLDDRVPLAVLVRDGKGTVTAGLVGLTFGRWLYIELLWVAEHLRGTGVGAELMARAEAEAHQRGCIGAHVNTGSFQAPGFYQRLGYEVCGILEDFPPGHARVSLFKRFDADSGQAQR